MHHSSERLISKIAAEREKGEVGRAKGIGYRHVEKRKELCIQVYYARLAEWKSLPRELGSKSAEFSDLL